MALRWPIDIHPETFVATSVAQRIHRWATVTHRRRGISVVTGPSGLGKSRTLAKFASEYPGEVVMATTPKRGQSPTPTLRFMCNAITDSVRDWSRYFSPNGSYELSNSIFSVLCHRDGVSTQDAHKARVPADHFTPLMVIFDEAQTLNRQTIEELRFYNEASTRRHSPFPIAFLFVGNEEFELAAQGDGLSPISRAVADRALYIERLSAASITDDDIRLYLESRGLADEAITRKIVTKLSTSDQIRSFRTLRRFFDRLEDEAEDGEAISELVDRYIRVQLALPATPSDTLKRATLR